MLDDGTAHQKTGVSGTDPKTVPPYFEIAVVNWLV